MTDDPRFTTNNHDGTTTCGNGRLVVTLPTTEFEKLGRYGVFNDAMRALANRSEAKKIQNEPVDHNEVISLAHETLVADYLAGNGRYNFNDTMMRLQGGHRMSAGMQAEVAAANAYAVGVLKPVEPQKLIDWVSEFFKTHDDSPESNREYRQQLKIEKLKIGAGVDHDAAEVLASALEILERQRMDEIKYRQAIGGRCADWKIEIVGEMPEQIGMCRYGESLSARELADKTGVQHSRIRQIAASIPGGSLTDSGWKFPSSAVEYVKSLPGRGRPTKKVLSTKQYNRE
jgi:hypothetical protein